MGQAFSTAAVRVSCAMIAGSMLVSRMSTICSLSDVMTKRTRLPADSGPLLSAPANMSRLANGLGVDVCTIVAFMNQPGSPPPLPD